MPVELLYVEHRNPTISNHTSDDLANALALKATGVLEAFSNLLEKDLDGYIGQYAVLSSPHNQLGGVLGNQIRDRIVERDVFKKNMVVSRVVYHTNSNSLNTAHQETLDTLMKGISMDRYNLPNTSTE